MKIEVNEKGSREFYREVVNVTSQYQKLVKKPEGKINDNFRLLKGYILLCAIVLVIITAMGIAWGMDGLTIAAIVLLVAAIAMSGVLLYRLMRMCDSLMNDPRSSVFTIDEKGIDFSKPEAEQIRIAWEHVAFVRVFDHSVCFVSKGVPGLVLALEKRWQSEVLAYIRDNHIAVTVIGG